MSDINHNSKVGKISVAQAEKLLSAKGNNGTVQVTVDEVRLFIHFGITDAHFVPKLDIPDTVQMTNGGTGPYKGSLILSTSGRGDLPPSIVLVNPKPPYNTTVLLDNYYGRQFNSLNDVKVHPQSGKIFFCDVPCVLSIYHIFRHEIN